MGSVGAVAAVEFNPEVVPERDEFMERAVVS